MLEWVSHALGFDSVPLLMRARRCQNSPPLAERTQYKPQHIAVEHKVNITALKRLVWQCYPTPHNNEGDTIQAVKGYAGLDQ